MSERYYLDTNALYAYYRDDMRSLAKNPKYQNYLNMHGGLNMRRLVSNAEAVYVSNLTYLEFLGVLMRHERAGDIKSKEVNSLIDRLKHDIALEPQQRHRFQLVPITDDIFNYARVLMIRYARKNQYELGTNDALHIAVAKLMQPEVKLVTSDGGQGHDGKFGKMKGVCQRIGLRFYDPEID